MHAYTLVVVVTLATGQARAASRVYDLRELCEQQSQWLENQYRSKQNADIRFGPIFSYHLNLDRAYRRLPHDDYQNVCDRRDARSMS